jgi:hypothetical protein
MRVKFKWEKWLDPLRPSDFHDPEEDDSEFHPSFKALPTPFGVLNITNHSLASTKFDFWMLHTNFRITNEIEEIMADVDGVESINVMTPYRVRFGFPISGLFNSEKIKTQVQEAVVNLFKRERGEAFEHFDTTTARKIREVVDYLHKKNRIWMVYVLPNGHMEVVTNDSSKNGHKFTQELDFFNQMQNLIGGQLIYSDQET